MKSDYGLLDWLDEDTKMTDKPYEGETAGDGYRAKLEATHADLRSLEAFLTNIPTKLRKQDVLNILDHTRRAIHDLLC